MLAALLALCVGVTLAFLALPIVALFVEVPLADVPGLLGDQAVQDALRVTARTNLVANVLIVAARHADGIRPRDARASAGARSS